MINKKELIKETLDLYQSDAALVVSDITRYWYTNFHSSAGFLVITKDEDYLLIDQRYYTAAKAQIQGVDVRPFKKLNDLVVLLDELKIKRFLVEKEYITLEQVELLWKMGYETVGYDTRNWRLVKDETALDILQHSADIAAETIEWIRHQDIIGLTEKKVAEMIHIHMLELGAVNVSFDPLIVATGLNGAVPHHCPDDTVLEEGNLVTVDIGCMYKYYASDITRTFALGAKLKDERLEKLYNTVLEANERGIAYAKANVTGAELDAISRDYIDSFAEYKGYFTHSTGHGVGLEVHELPNITPSNKTLLKADNVCTIEPGIYIPGLGGARVEDTIVIKDDGCVVLTRHASKDLYNK